MVAGSAGSRNIQGNPFQLSFSVRIDKWLTAYKICVIQRFQFSEDSEDQRGYIQVELTK